MVERPLLLLLWVGLQRGTAALRPAWRAAFAAVGIAAGVAAAATGAERSTARVWLLGLLLRAQAVGRLRVARLLLAVAPARFAALHAQFEVGQGRFAAPQGLSLQQAPTACCRRPLPGIIAMVRLVYAPSTAAVAAAATATTAAVAHAWLGLTATIAAHRPGRLLRRPSHGPSSTINAARVAIHVAAIKRGPRRPGLQWGSWR